MSKTTVSMEWIDSLCQDKGVSRRDIEETFSAKRGTKKDVTKASRSVAEWLGISVPEAKAMYFLLLDD